MTKMRLRATETHVTRELISNKYHKRSVTVKTKKKHTIIEYVSKSLNELVQQVRQFSESKNVKNR